MTNQRTITRDVDVKGVGLHTGNICHAIFKPAEVNTGITLVRSDLPGKPSIQALYTNVIGVIRGTTVGNDRMRVHTIEHMLSALYALGIDNAVIEMTANEPPIVDGSSQVFYDSLVQVGSVDQNVSRRFFKPSEPFEYRQNESLIRIEPADELILSVEINYPHPLINQQTINYTLQQDTYRSEIAPARTFCFDYEVEALKKQGLARGGSLDNAVVVGLDRIHNKEKKLRFPDEFVRHKTLDLLGDLYLLGCRLKGHVTAVRPGHGHNTSFVKQLAEHFKSLFPTGAGGPFTKPVVANGDPAII